MFISEEAWKRVELVWQSLKMIRSNRVDQFCLGVRIGGLPRKAGVVLQRGVACSRVHSVADWSRGKRISLSEWVAE